MDEFDRFVGGARLLLLGGAQAQEQKARRDHTLFLPFAPAPMKIKTSVWLLRHRKQLVPAALVLAAILVWYFWLR